MSETTNRAEEKREPFVLELEEPLDFEYDAKVSFLTSDKVGRLINELCKAGFPDYEGCKIEVAQNGELNLSLVFRHELNRGENTNYGVELASAKKTNNSTLDRSRGRDWAVQNGDRYTLTDYAKEIITPWLKSKYRSNGDKKINWGSLTSEFSESKNIYSFKTEQFTKVSGLDLNIICSLLFGKKDPKGDTVVYDVQYRGVVNTVPGFNVNGAQNFVLWVTQVDFDKVQKTYVDLGLGSPSSIIR